MDLFNVVRDGQLVDNEEVSPSGKIGMFLGEVAQTKDEGKKVTINIP